MKMTVEETGNSEQQEGNKEPCTLHMFGVIAGSVQLALMLHTFWSFGEKYLALAEQGIVSNGGYEKIGAFLIVFSLLMAIFIAASFVDVVSAIIPRFPAKNWTIGVPVFGVLLGVIVTTFIMSPFFSDSDREARIDAIEDMLEDSGYTHVEYAKDAPKDGEGYYVFHAEKDGTEYLVTTGQEDYERVTIVDIVEETDKPEEVGTVISN